MKIDALEVDFNATVTRMNIGLQACTGMALSSGISTKHHQTLFQQSVAHFSPCERYRYW